MRPPSPARQINTTHDASGLVGAVCERLGRGSGGTLAGSFPSPKKIWREIQRQRRARKCTTDLSRSFFLPASPAHPPDLRRPGAIENPARWRGHLDKLLPARPKVRKVRHHAAMPYASVPGFLAELREQGGVAVRALEFAILT